ncbi:MAG: hypothetical protein J5965_00620, partial [Aeriscardovia sp.]|nr:hypothetical protein [Aeriscardovia sp.]MBO6256142.1 hypothetical protein [Bacteroidaceae bacterium]
KLLKIADIKEFIRLKTIKLADNQIVTKVRPLVNSIYITLGSRTASPYYRRLTPVSRPSATDGWNMPSYVAGPCWLSHTLPLMLFLLS